jgi:hypothetical protein
MLSRFLTLLFGIWRPQASWSLRVILFVCFNWRTGCYPSCPAPISHVYSFLLRRATAIYHFYMSEMRSLLFFCSSVLPIVSVAPFRHKVYNKKALFRTRINVSILNSNQREFCGHTWGSDSKIDTRYYLCLRLKTYLHKFAYPYKATDSIWFVIVVTKYLNFAIEKKS